MHTLYVERMKQQKYQNNILSSEDEERMNLQAKVQPITPRNGVPRIQHEDEAVPKNLKELLYERLGVEELLSTTLWRASIAELIGTAILVFMIDTTVISCTLTNSKNTNVLVSVLVFIIVTMLTVAIAPVSGGHINPIVSFASTLMGLISPTRAIVYILAHCLGAMLGVVALKQVVDETMGHIFSLGGCTISPARGSGGHHLAGIAIGNALLLEAICTFVFLFVSISIAFDHRRAQAHGLVVVSVMVGATLGLLTFVSTTVTAKAGYSGAGLNPAKCIGSAVVRGGHLWDGHWVFWVGPGVSCLVFYAYVKLIPDQLVLVVEPKFDLVQTIQVLFSAWPKRWI